MLSDYVPSAARLQFSNIWASHNEDGRVRGTEHNTERNKKMHKRASRLLANVFSLRSSSVEI